MAKIQDVALSVIADTLVEKMDTLKRSKIELDKAKNALAFDAVNVIESMVDMLEESVETLSEDYKHVKALSTVSWLRVDDYSKKLIRKYAGV